MDALEFLKERKRMCNSYSHCEGCPFDDSKCVIDSTISGEDFKRTIAIVEQWSKEHPAQDAAERVPGAVSRGGAD